MAITSAEAEAPDWSRSRRPRGRYGRHYGEQGWPARHDPTIEDGPTRVKANVPTIKLFSQSVQREVGRGLGNPHQRAGRTSIKETPEPREYFPEASLAGAIRLAGVKKAGRWRVDRLTQTPEPRLFHSLVDGHFTGVYVFGGGESACARGRQDGNPARARGSKGRISR